MSKEKNKNGGLLFCLALFIAYAVMPIISLYVPAVVRVLLMLLILGMIAFRAGISALTGYLSKLVPVYLFEIINVIRLLFVGPDQIINVLYDLFSLILISCIFFYITEGNRAQISKSLTRTVLVIYIITTITTIIGNSIYPEASRQLATGMTGESVLFNTYRAMNIGGFGFVYETTLPVALLPYVFKQKKVPRLLAIAVYVLVLYCAYVTQYTIAFIIVLSYGAFFFTRQMKNSKSMIRSLVVFSIVVILFLSTILQFMTTSLDSKLMTERFEEVGNIVTGEGATSDSDVGARQSLYTKSIMDFLSNPLTGTGKNGGGHSYILDHMAKYGIWGLIGLIIMMKSIFKLYIKPYRNTVFYGYMVLAFLVFFMVTLLNPSPLHLSISFLLPLLAYRLKVSEEVLK